MPTVIQYEGAKRYINLSSEGEARHVCETCDSNCGKRFLEIHGL